MNFYFFSLGYVKAFVYSPHYDKINVSFSLDGESWKPVKIFPSNYDKDDLKKYTFIDRIPLNQKFKIFIKIEKISDDPLTVTDYYIEPYTTITIKKFNFREGKRGVLIVLVFVAFLGTSFTILYSYKELVYKGYLISKKYIKKMNLKKLEKNE